jgi:hypothetical protein
LPCFRLLTTVTFNPSYYYQMSVGFSGILFCYAVIESYHTIETSRSVFGFFNVPAKLYPFTLLIVLSVRAFYVIYRKRFH